MPHKVQLLGELVVLDDAGERKDTATGGPLRIIVSLAIRPGEPRSEHELTRIVWPEYPTNAPDLAVPIARARKWINIPNKTRGSSTFTVTLARSDVDLTDFIDRVANLESLASSEVDELLGLWRGDPKAIHGFLGPAEFDPLVRARVSLINHISAWGRDELAKLRNLERFRGMFEEECGGLPATTAMAPAKRLLLVDDDEDLTAMVSQLLGGYQIQTAHTVGVAMAAITDHTTRIDGALVDLHLTSRGMDSQGLQVLDALRVHRPAVPRILMTSAPPADALSHVQQEYGLYEILVKNSREAPVRTRRIVDEMMSDAAELVIRRARATLDTLTSRVEIAGNRRVVAASQGVRRGTASQAELDAAIRELERIAEQAGAARSAVENAATGGEAEEVIAAYTAEFAALLGTEGVQA